MNILSLLRALSHRNIRGGRRTGRALSRKPSPYRPRIEALEDRSMLSSIQMLPLGDGTFQLRVDGDAKANQVSIVGIAPVAQSNDYSLVVTCDQLKPMTVDHVLEVVIDTAGGADTVLLTGQWAFQGKGETMSGVRSISVNTRGGDDEVRFIDFSGQSLNGIVPGPRIEIDTGSGNDLAWFRPIFHPPTLFAGLELSVRTGEGEDSVLVENLAFAASSADAPTTFGAVLPTLPNDSRIGVDSGTGGDVVSLGNWSLGTAIIGPEVGLSGGGVSLSVETGAGRDKFLFHDNDLIAGSFNAFVDLGSGDDAATFEDNIFGSGLVQKVIGGDGNDLAFFLCNEIAGSFDASVDLGTGDDAATFMGNTFGGSVQLTVNGDAGNDRIEIGGADNDGDDYAGMMYENQFKGSLALTITGGSGDDLAFFECDEIAGSFAASIDLGSGDDAATFEDNVFGGDLNLAIIGGSGDDLAFFLCDEIAGSFGASVNLGDGHDAATFMGNTFGSPVELTVNGGAGNDRIEIGGADNDGDDDAGMMYENQFKGSLALTITGGSGDDLAFFECDEIAGSFAASIDLGSGDDAATFEDNVFGGGLNMAIIGGSGDDLAFFLCDASIGSFDASIDLGNGDDTATFMGNTFGSPVQLIVNGGAGNDRIEIGGVDNDGDDYAGMMYENQFKGSLELTITGGSGADLAFFQCDEIAGALNAYVNLDKGDDAATFLGNTFGGPVKLIVNGGAGNDRIEIGGADNGGDDYAGMMYENQFKGSLELTITGGSGADLAFFQCNEIAGSFDASIDVGSGDDAAKMHDNQFEGGLALTITGGSGHDFVFFSDNELAGALNAYIDLGTGDDTTMFALNAYTGSLLMTVLGGDGKDLVTIQCDGLGPVSLLVDLGDGNDTADVNLTLLNQDPAQHKPFTVRVLGGKGNDDLTLAVKADPEVLAAANLLIDGGSGFDQGKGGPFVKIVNCEQ